MALFRSLRSDRRALHAPFYVSLSPSGGLWYAVLGFVAASSVKLLNSSALPGRKALVTAVFFSPVYMLGR